MTRFNIAALQEQGMTRDEINEYIREKERAMYGGPRGTSASGPPRDIGRGDGYPGPRGTNSNDPPRDIGRGDGYSEPDTPREVYPTQTETFTSPTPIQIPISGEQGDSEREKIKNIGSFSSYRPEVESSETAFQELLGKMKNKKRTSNSEDESSNSLSKFEELLKKIKGQY